MSRKSYRIKGPNAGGHPVGTICYDQAGHDYGLANDDTRMTGHRHVSVTLNADGGYPGFTIRADYLEPIMTRSNTPEPSLPVALKKTYIKPLRTIVEIDARYADKIRDMLNATPIPDTSAGEREMVQQSIATKQSTDATGDSASETAVGLNWHLSAEARAQISEIESNARNGLLNAHKFVAGNESVFGGTNFCGHAMMATLCPVCTPAVAETCSNAPENVGLLHGISADPPSSAGERMREAAQAVIDRWDTPNWKDAPATAVVINNLRAAIALQGPSGKTGGEG